MEKNRFALSSIKPVQRSKIVAEQLISAIRSQHINVGDKLPPERELSKAMNVSRNTLREAIAALQLLGFFEVRRSSGIFLVKQPDDTEILDAVSNVYAGGPDPYTAIDARIAIEPGAAILAARNATPDDWAMLNHVYEDMKRARLEGDYAKYMQEDRNFHRLIARATQNELLVQALDPILDSMSQPMWRTMKTSIHTSEIWGASYEEHRLILETMRSNDEYMIFRAMTAHLTRSKSRLTAKMVEQDSFNAV